MKNWKLTKVGDCELVALIYSKNNRDAQIFHGEFEEIPLAKIGLDLDIIEMWYGEGAECSRDYSLISPDGSMTRFWLFDQVRGVAVGGSAQFVTEHLRSLKMEHSEISRLFGEAVELEQVPA